MPLGTGSRGALCEMQTRLSKRARARTHEDEETRRGKYSSAATMKNNKRSLSADDDARKEKKKKKKKETEKGEEKHRTIPEEEERDGFKSPTERELRKRNGGSLPIATTQSYYAIWRACSKKAEKKTSNRKERVRRS